MATEEKIFGKGNWSCCLFVCLFWGLSNLNHGCCTCPYVGCAFIHGLLNINLWFIRAYLTSNLKLPMYISIYFYSFQNQQLTITPTAITLRGEELNRTRRTNWSVTSKTSIREQRLALLLVSVAVSFVLFTLPANVAFLWYEFGHIDTTKSETLTPLFITTNFMESINYSINFYIYCAVHEEIRNSFIDLCNAALSKIVFWRKSQNPTTTHW